MSSPFILVSFTLSRFGIRASVSLGTAAPVAGVLASVEGEGPATRAAGRMGRNVSRPLGREPRTSGSRRGRTGRRRGRR